MNESYKLKLKYLDNPKISLEIFDSLIGDFIGSGCTREVFEYVPSKDFVVKIENGNASGDNFAEYNLWRAIENTEASKWFAPCQWISPNGMILVQRKTLPLFEKPESKIPDKIPIFFSDIHSGNFGWIKNQLVSHDYAFSLGVSIKEIAKSKKMQSTHNKLKNWK